MTDLFEVKKSLFKVHPFSEEQLSLFTDKLIYKKLRKGDFLLNENEVSNSMAFILSGSLRYAKKKKHGDLTLKFFTENNWVADVESLLTQQPAKNYLEAMEDTAIVSISLIDVHTLMDRHPCFRMLNALMADLTISTSYIATIQAKSPDERYNELLVEHPHWINRFPQMQIASYLGMTPETLSRVKARMK
jgi:CRP-like cAMP-binding protein